MRISLIGMIAVVGLGLGGAAGADDDLALNELPEPVRRTVLAETGEGNITDIEEDQSAGQAVYEIEFVQEEVKYEIDVAADGTLLKRHRD